MAVRVFNERGYDGTSVEDLAQTPGVTKSAIHHHLSGKTEPPRQSLDRAPDNLSAVTREPGTTNGHATNHLKHVPHRAVLVERPHT